tara:strand:- start:11291 stop:12322 length:1032 start_codon:yes stop_codon:yes gene_type:complete
MKNMSKHMGSLGRTLLVIVGLLLVISSGLAQDYQKIKDLNGSWKFSIGDDQYWASPNFNDSNWESITVPSAWENQGFNGYDGFAWYRTKFSISQNLEKRNLYLQLGNIDDVDEVFINGKRIGKSGNFPPHFATAYNSNRIYAVPVEYLKNNNTIAVRVYDDMGEGGIIRGDISLLIDRSAVPLDINMQGTWKFKTGKYAHEDIANIKNWDDIIVPGFWENQGYKNYDGYACYAYELQIDSDIITDKMILLLGRIDDIDQVFINGVLIGQSGPFKPSTVDERTDCYRQNRAYYIPKELLKSEESLLITVRVYDRSDGGGIYKGPIGLISQPNYIKYWNSRRKRQ